MPQRDRLAEMAKQIQSCTRCPLHRTRTRAVPGEGPDRPRVMLIGEAPGFYEDRSGRPFVGAAGKFLNALLARAGLSREEVFITNILKCRPPRNRDPLPAEVEACKPYLEEQIRLLNPRVIVTLGRFAMAYFLPQARISRVHGQPFQVGARWVVPMYHPAAGLYRESLRPVIEADFDKLRSLLATLDRQGALPLS